MLVIGVLALQSSGDTWPHLIANVLPGAVRRTLALMAGVTLLIGTGTAWLVTMELRIFCSGSSTSIPLPLRCSRSPRSIATRRLGYRRRPSWLQALRRFSSCMESLSQGALDLDQSAQHGLGREPWGAEELLITHKIRRRARNLRPIGLKRPRVLGGVIEVAPVPFGAVTERVGRTA